MRRLLTLFWMCFIPAATFAAGWWFAHKALAGAPPTMLTCADATLFGAKASGACAAAEPAILLMLVSAGLIVASFAVLAVFRMLARTAGLSRLLLAAAFRTSSIAAVIAGGLVASAQILLATAAVFVAWRYSDPLADPVLLAPFALLALIVALMGVFYSLRLFERLPMGVVAYAVSERDQPRLMALIHDIAKRVDARPPDNVILGLEPNFFAASGHVQLPARSDSLKGETLYLSLPYLRVLTLGEITGVIGHELAHFTGRDTAFSRHFGPSYAGLIQAYGDFARGGNIVERLFTYPARELIADMLGVFDRVIARIDREREKRADQIGASVSSPEDLGCALVKTGVFGALWGFEFQELVKRCGVEFATRNLSRNFADSVEYDLNGPDLQQMIRKSLDSRVPHPSDRHPTTAARLALLGFSEDRLSDPVFIEQRFLDARGAAEDLDALDFLEEQLTTFYKKHFRPDSPSNGMSPSAFAFSRMLSDFMALMVVADGVVASREIAVAERRAKEAFKEFDSRDFRERCRHASELPDLAVLVRFASKHLTAAEAAELKRILREVAMADGALDEREAAMMEHIERHLQGTFRGEQQQP